MIESGCCGKHGQCDEVNSKEIFTENAETEKRSGYAFASGSNLLPTEPCSLVKGGVRKFVQPTHMAPYAQG